MLHKCRNAACHIITAYRYGIGSRGAIKNAGNSGFGSSGGEITIAGGDIVIDCRAHPSTENAARSRRLLVSQYLIDAGKPIGGLHCLVFVGALFIQSGESGLSCLRSSDNAGLISLMRYASGLGFSPLHFGYTSGVISLCCGVTLGKSGFTIGGELGQKRGLVAECALCGVIVAETKAERECEKIR